MGWGRVERQNPCASPFVVTPISGPAPLTLLYLEHSSLLSSCNNMRLYTTIISTTTHVCRGRHASPRFMSTGCNRHQKSLSLPPKLVAMPSNAQQTPHVVMCLSKTWRIYLQSKTFCYLRNIHSHRRSTVHDVTSHSNTSHSFK